LLGSNSTPLWTPAHFPGRHRPGGVFGVEYLHDAGDFAKAAKAAVTICNTLVREVERSAAILAEHHDGKVLVQQAAACLQQLDAISDTLCKVLDPAECCRNVHEGERWRDAAEHAFGSLGAYMFALNAHFPLYDALRRITGNAAIMGAFSGEQRRMAVMLQREFERDGIHLPDDKRQALVALNSEVNQLASAFSAGAGGALVTAEVPLATFPSLPRLPAELRRSCKVLSAAGQPMPLEKLARMPAEALQGAVVRMHLTHHQVDELLLRCPDEAPRRTVLAAQLRSHADNVPALHALRDKRAQIACEWVGLPSYAHMVSYDRLAGSPANSVAFLQKLAAALLPRALEELAALAEAKAAHAAERRARAVADSGICEPGATESGATELAATEPGAAAGAGTLQRVEDACVRLVLAAAQAGALPQAWDVPFYSHTLLGTGPSGGGAEGDAGAGAGAGGGGGSVRADAQAVSAWAAGDAKTGAAVVFPGAHHDSESAASSAEAPGEGADTAASRGSSRADTPLMEHYSLSNVIRGLDLVCRRLFGVSLQLEALGRTEVWDGGESYPLPAAAGESAGARGVNSAPGAAQQPAVSSSSSSASSSPSFLASVFGAGRRAVAPRASQPRQSRLLKFTLLHETEGPLGTIYMDLFPRPDKFGGAAHFVVRSGKARHSYDGGLEKLLGAPPPPSATSPVTHGAVDASAGQSAFQLPVLSIVTNFTPSVMPGECRDVGETSGPDGSASDAASDEQHRGQQQQKDGRPQLPPHLLPLCLTPTQAITLWHEFGHALHTCLSRVAYQHLAGTRGALDFVEVPSHTMEHWARDERVVALWARSRDGAPLPHEAFMRHHVAAQSTSPHAAFGALDMLGSVCNALFDLALHGDADVIDSIVNPLPAASVGAGGSSGGVGGSSSSGVGGAYRMSEGLGEGGPSPYDIGDNVAQSAASSSAGAASGGRGTDSCASSTGSSSSDSDGGWIVRDYKAVPRLADVLSAILRSADAWAHMQPHASESRDGGRALRAADLSPEQRRGILALLQENGLLVEELCVLQRTGGGSGAGCEADAAAEDEEEEASLPAAVREALAIPLADPLRELQPSGSEDLGSDQPRQRHSSSSSSSSSSAFRRAWHRDSSALLAAVQSRYSLVPPVEGSAWQGGFSHLVTYGAGYYSYLYATAFSAALWQRLFAADPLSRAAGERFRRELLSRGGGDDPADILVRLLQQGAPAGSEPGSPQGGAGAATPAQQAGAAAHPQRRLSLFPLLRSMGAL
jgi:Zn-dependent oligopeptidase